MAKTHSGMVELGTTCPAFELVDVVSGKALSRDDIFAASWDDRASDQLDMSPQGAASQAGRHGLLVIFACVHCPYVKHVEQALAQIGADYDGSIAVAAISSNDVDQYPEDAPEHMKQQADRLGWRFPYLFDETQEVARSFGAVCTPEFFLYDGELCLAYRGQLDSSRPRRGDAGNDEPITGADLRRAIDDVIAGRRPDTNQRTSLGCNIKFRT